MQFRSFDFHGKAIRGFEYDARSKDIVLVFHGFMGNKCDHHFMMKTFCEDIVQCGFRAYRFDFLGSGDSDGSFFEEERITSQLEQGRMLIDSYVRENYNVHIFAFSMGGVIASHLANEKDVKSLFLLSPAGNFNEILTGMLMQGRACDDGYEFNGFHIHPDFIEEVATFPYFEGIGCKGMVKIVQGSSDQYVSKDSRQTYQASFKQCECVEIPNADHCYSTLAHTQLVRKEIVSFYGKIKNMAIEKQ